MYFLEMVEETSLGNLSNLAVENEENEENIKNLNSDSELHYLQNKYVFN